MIRNKKSAMLAALALTAFAAAAQDGLVLRRSLTEGATDTYKVETISKQVLNLPNGAGEQDMGATMLATYKVKTGKVDAEKKQAAVELTLTVDKVEMEGPMAGMMGQAETGKPVALPGTLDERGRLTMLPPKGSSGAMAEVMSSTSAMGGSVLSIELPEKAVAVGDTWDVVVPKSPFSGNEDQKLTAKLVGEKDVDGKPAFIVSTEGVIKTDADLSKMAEEAQGPMKGQKMTIKGTIELKADGVVEKSTGRTLRLTSKMKMKQTVELPDMGFTIDVSGTTTTVTSLK